MAVRGYGATNQGVWFGVCKEGEYSDLSSIQIGPFLVLLSFYIVIIIIWNGGDSVNIINTNWKRVPGVGVKEVYDVNGVVKAEIIFDYEKERVVTVSGNLYQLIGFENQEKYADYLSVKEKMAKDLYNKNW